MPEIHPTSFVDQDAELADDVMVGPWCVIGGAVRIGAGTRLIHRVTLRGPLSIGKHNTIYPEVCIGFAPQDRAYDPEHHGAGVVIGNHNVLREGVTIHRATKDQPTTLGDHNYLMCNSHLGHDVIVGHRCTLANCVLLAGHAQVDDDVILGGSAGVHQLVRIGRMAILSGMYAVTQDVPPFCAAYFAVGIASLNLVGLRRAGLRQHIRPLQHAFNLFFREKKANINAINDILDDVGHDPLVQEFVDFIRHTKRGISPYGGGKKQARLSPIDPKPTDTDVQHGTV